MKSSTKYGQNLRNLKGPNGSKKTTISGLLEKEYPEASKLAAGFEKVNAGLYQTRLDAIRGRNRTTAGNRWTEYGIDPEVTVDGYMQSMLSMMFTGGHADSGLVLRGGGTDWAAQGESDRMPDEPETPQEVRRPLIPIRPGRDAFSYIVDEPGGRWTWRIDSLAQAVRSGERDEPPEYTVSPTGRLLSRQNNPR